MNNNEELSSIIGNMTPDELLNLNPMLSTGVRILINACKESAAGRHALDNWDKLRGNTYQPYINLSTCWNCGRTDKYCLCNR